MFNQTFPEGILQCIARPEKLKTALLWLKENNKWYRDIEISVENISMYPENGDITHLIQRISMNADINLDIPTEDGLNSFVPDRSIIKQDDVFYHKLDMPYPELEKITINEFQKNGYFSKAFPALLPYGTGDYSNYHIDDNFSFSEYCKFFVQYKDRRFAQNFRFRYFLYNTSIRHQLLLKANVYIKQGQWQNENVESFKNIIEINPKLLNSMVCFTRQLKSTTAYWKSKCVELLDMCKQLRTPRIFFTLSAADYHWPDLYKVIAPNRKFEDLTSEDRRELMQQNPILVGYFFQYRLEQFVKLVLKPVYNIVDYWYGDEWQSRGSTHAHGVLWLKDAPNFAETNYTPDQIQELTNYFQNIVFAVNPHLKYGDIHPSQQKFSDIADDAQEVDLQHLLAHVQRHTKCGTHCLRRNLNSNIVSCRYKFPCSPKEIAEINDDDGYLRFHPKRDDTLLQRYSSVVMKSWRANHDFSPICSSEAVVYYVAKYIAKNV